MKGLFIFAAGLAIGAVAGACVIKNKVLADAKEEIEEVREYYRSKSVEATDEVAEEVKEVKEVKEVVEEVKEVVQEIKNGSDKRTYVNYNKLASTYKPQEEPTRFDDPFIIDPSEFGEDPEYDTMTLTYFADGVLVDDVDEVIEEPDIVVGLENLKVFEEFGASSIYVRNDIYKTDYEVIRDDWNYSDIKEYPIVKEPSIVKEKKPHQL